MKNDSTFYAFNNKEDGNSQTCRATNTAGVLKSTKPGTVAEFAGAA